MPPDFHLLFSGLELALLEGSRPVDEDGLVPHEFRFPQSIRKMGLQVGKAVRDSGFEGESEEDVLEDLVVGTDHGEFEEV